MQFALGLKIAQDNSDIQIRFEKPFKDQYVDIVIFNHEIIGVELKYKTSELEFTDKHNSETFHLKEHAAIDLGRFDVIKDIQKLEQLVCSNQITKGYVLFVTNCSTYWTNQAYKGSDQALDTAFRLIDKRVLSGTLKWHSNVKVSTCGKKRINGIELKGSYQVNWKDLVDLGCNNGVFRYMIIEIPPEQH